MKEKLIKYLKWFLNSYIWLGLLLLVIDIVTKNVIVQNRNNILSSGGRNGGVDLIPGFLGINYVINTNIVFGLDIFKNEIANRLVFVIVAVIISAAIIFYLLKKWGKVNRFYKACLFMIIAGALGNAIDRIFFTSEYLGSEFVGVVDWIDFYGIWKFNFNIADSAIVVAVIMLIIYMITVDIVEYRRKSKQRAPVEAKKEKVLSKTEQEKNQYLEDNKPQDE